MTLYEIDRRLESCIDPETGELDEEKYSALTMQREEKLENTVLFYKNLSAEMTALKNEKDAFEKRIKAIQKRMDSLERQLAFSLEGEPFKTARCSVKFSPSQRVEIEDMSAIPESFLVPQAPKIDKIAVKAALRAGESVPGAKITEYTNIQIK